MAVAEVVDLAQLGGWFGRLGDQAARIDLGPALRAAAVLIGADLKRNFAGGHAPDGTPWRPLAHARVRGGTKPLRDTGLLMASVTAQGPGHVERVSATEVVYGTNLDRAALHQHGGTVRPTKGRFLAIPLTRPALLAGSPRRFGGGLHFRGGGGGGVLLNSAGQAQYALARAVTIPARPFVGFSGKLVERLDQLLAAFAAQKLAEAR